MTFFVFFILSYWLISDSEQSAECVAKCEMIEIPDDLVPKTYNKCVCEIQFTNSENRSESPLKCKPLYRSLKFREKTFGTVVLHKAVVKTCSGMGYRIIVNQSIFDNEESDFLHERNIVKPETSFAGGYRNNIMNIYRKPDGHLRFGKK